MNLNEPPRHDSRTLFSSKVAEYISSRPDYPPALFDELATLGIGGHLITAMPSRDSAARRRAIDALCAVFESFESEDCVTVRYKTIATIGRPA